MHNTSWTVTVEEAEDGSGDIVLPLPPELLETQGWKEGDIFKLVITEDGKRLLKKIDPIEKFARGFDNGTGS